MTATPAPAPAATPLPTSSFRFRPISPAVILADPTAVAQAATAYLHRTMPHGPSHLSEDHPTPEGLARAIGFSSFQHMRQTIEKRMEQQASHTHDSTPAYDSTIHTILAACSDLQDYYLKHGLSSTLNTSVTRFISSAYFRINESRETNVTSHATSSSTITIKVAATNPDELPPEERREIERLTEHLATQTANELQAMNKTKRRLIAPTVSLDDVI